MRHPLIAAAAIVMSLTTVAETSLAEDVNSIPDPRMLGVQTQSWIDLQKSGSAASPAARPVPGEIAQKQYDRYAESFSHPIPEYFNREKIVSDEGGK